MVSEPQHQSQTIKVSEFIEFANFLTISFNNKLPDRTPMHLAAENGHASIIELLADKFRASIFERTKDGSTLMHIASLNGHADCAQMLFKKGVFLHMPNKGGARRWKILNKSQQSMKCLFILQHSYCSSKRPRWYNQHASSKRRTRGCNHKCENIFIK